MLTGEIRSQIDQIWNTFWTGGIANPLEVIEQITYLLFIRRLDELHTLEEHKAARLKRPLDRRIFPEGADPRGRPNEDLRWSRFRNMAPAEMFTVVGEHVFPFLRSLGNDGSTYSHHMKDEREQIAHLNLMAGKRARAATAAAIGITLHDHLVIGRAGHASFRSLGLL